MKQTPLSKETLEENLILTATSLLKLARESTWNKIADNYAFILSEHDYELVDRVRRKLVNDKRQPKTLDELMPVLLQLYPDVYEFDLYVYKSTPKQTIIEIGYILADPSMGAVPSPHLHAKVSIPVYATFKKRKFDINWQHNTLLHKWNIFWARLRFKIFPLKRQIRNRK